MAPKDRAFRGDFSGAILAKVNPDGTVEIMVVGVTEKERVDWLRANNREPTTGDINIKLPGGCADNPDASPGQVLAQEVREECFEGTCVLGPSLLVFEKRKPSRFSGIPDHIQRFFLVMRWEGELRKRDMLEDEGDEYLSPPTMVEFRKLYKIIFGTHLVPLFKGLEALVKTNALVAGEYADLLAEFNSGKIKPTFRPKVVR